MIIYAGNQSYRVILERYAKPTADSVHAAMAELGGCHYTGSLPKVLDVTPAANYGGGCHTGNLPKALDVTPATFRARSARFA